MNKLATEPTICVSNLNFNVEEVANVAMELLRLSPYIIGVHNLTL